MDRARFCTLPFGTFTAERAAGIHLVDVLGHTWDVATAVGIDPGGDDDLWATAHREATHFVGPDRDPRHYADEEAVPTPATARERFLAYLGRPGAWRQ